ncbi:hypothetical protein ACSFA3_11120 [Variovorax sp. RHLX14]|uniref:hypothetical protein n=1 Tax=Variovorax sp. RHLX14 TaxID=1259731 RepID=UPI003F455787
MSIPSLIPASLPKQNAPVDANKVAADAGPVPYTRTAPPSDLARAGGRPTRASAHADLREVVLSGNIPMLRRYLTQKPGPQNLIDVNGSSPTEKQGLLHDVMAKVNDPKIQIAVVKELLRQGADPNKKNCFGMTALDVAARRTKPNFTAIQTLLNAGGRISIDTVNRATELRSQGKPDLFNILVMP